VAAGEDEHSSATTEHRMKMSKKLTSEAQCFQRSGSAAIHADQSPDLSTLGHGACRDQTLGWGRCCPCPGF
jgi:hypothetical protein